MKINFTSLVCFIMPLMLMLRTTMTDANFPYKNMPDMLPGTGPLTWQGDLSVKMLDGAHKFIEEKIEESVSSRAKLWNRDFSSPSAYERSVEPNRKRFMKYIGVEDKSKPV